MKGYYIILIVLLFTACSEYDYYTDIEEQLNSGTRNDSLFLGYYFGMDRQDFFDYSWELNRNKMAKQGQFNQSIQYTIYDKDLEVQMNFYPHFDSEQKISNMPVVYVYPAWAPWGKKIWSDKLILHVRDLLEKRDNVKFNLIQDINGTFGFVNITGNKRTIITVRDDQKVNVMHTDLTSLDNPLDSLVFNKKYE